jgi:hypothetical protein
MMRHAAAARRVHSGCCGATVGSSRLLSPRTAPRRGLAAATAALARRPSCSLLAVAAPQQPPRRHLSAAAAAGGARRRQQQQPAPLTFGVIEAAVSEIDAALQRGDMEQMKARSASLFLENYHARAKAFADVSALLRAEPEFAGGLLQTCVDTGRLATVTRATISAAPFTRCSHILICLTLSVSGKRSGQHFGC